MAITDILLQRHQQVLAADTQEWREREASQHQRTAMINAFRTHLAAGEYILLAANGRRAQQDFYVYKDEGYTQAQVQNHIREQEKEKAEQAKAEKEKAEKEKAEEKTPEDDDEGDDDAGNEGVGSRPPPRASLARRKKRGRTTGAESIAPDLPDPFEYNGTTGSGYRVAAGGFCNNKKSRFYGSNDGDVVDYTEELHNTLFQSKVYAAPPIDLTHALLVDELRQKRDVQYAPATEHESPLAEDAVRAEFVRSLALRMTPDALAVDFEVSMNAIRDCLLTPCDTSSAFHSWNITFGYNGSQSDHVHIPVNGTGVGHGQDKASGSSTIYTAHSTFNDETNVTTVRFMKSDSSMAEGAHLLSLTFNPAAAAKGEVTFTPGSGQGNLRRCVAIALPRNGGGFDYEGIHFSRPVANSKGQQYVSREGHLLEIKMRSLAPTTASLCNLRVKSNAWTDGAYVTGATVTGNGTTYDDQRVLEARSTITGIVESASCAILGSVCDSMRLGQTTVSEQEGQLSHTLQGDVLAFMAGVNMHTDKVYIAHDTKEFTLIPIDPSLHWATEETCAEIVFETALLPEVKHGVPFVWCNTTPATRLDALEAAAAYAYTHTEERDGHDSLVTVQAAHAIQSAASDNLLMDASAAVSARIASQIHVFAHLRQKVVTWYETQRTDASAITVIVDRCYMLARYAETAKAYDTAEDLSTAVSEWIGSAQTIVTCIMDLIENDVIRAENSNEWENLVAGTYIASTDDEKALITFVFSPTTEDYNDMVDNLGESTGNKAMTLAIITAYVEVGRFFQFTSPNDHNTELVQIFRTLAIELAQNGYTAFQAEFGHADDAGDDAVGHPGSSTFMFFDAHRDTLQRMPNYVKHIVWDQFKDLGEFAKLLLGARPSDTDSGDEDGESTGGEEGSDNGDGAYDDDDDDSEDEGDGPKRAKKNSKGKGQRR